MHDSRWLASAKLIKAIIKAAVPNASAYEVARRLEFDLDSPSDDARVGIAGPRTLWGEIRRVSDEPLVGLRSALRVELDAMGAFLQLLKLCPDLRSLIEVTRNYMVMIDTGHRASLRVEADQAVFDWHFVGRSGSRDDVDFCAMIGTRIAKLLLPQFRLSEVRLPHQPNAEEAAEYERLFECPVRFGMEETGGVFPMQLLDERIPGGDRPAFDRLCAWASTQVPALNQAHRLGLVEIAYDAAVREGLDDASAIARRLGLSTRTMRRQLQSFGTTHRLQRDRARRAVAVAMLRESNASLTEVAMKVGFTDAAAFTRAFRRWMGTTPGAYRRNHRERPVFNGFHPWQPRQTAPAFKVE